MVETKNIDNLVIPVDRFSKNATNAGKLNRESGFLARNAGNTEAGGIGSYVPSMSGTRPRNLAGPSQVGGDSVE